jgi:hypothetical protein
MLGLWVLVKGVVSQVEEIGVSAFFRDADPGKMN